MTFASAKPSVPTPQLRQAERKRPEEKAALHQRWENLLFVHWRWDPVIVQRALPAGLTVDLYHGGAWIGLVPSFMRGVRPNFLPALPLVSEFFQLELRTYVYDAQGRPGLYFFSIDCNQPLVVEAAKRVLNLNYVHSRIEASVDAEGFVNFRAQRMGGDVADAFRYRALPGNLSLEPATLEFFLFERHRLFTADPAGAITTLRVYHPSIALHRAESIVLDPVTIRLAGFDPKGRAPDHICLASPVDAEVFLPEPVAPPKR